MAVMIKGMEMPSCCWGYKENGEDYECPLYHVCKNRDSFLVNNKPSDCPLIEIEEPKTAHWVDDEVDSFSKSFGYKKFHCSRCLKVIEGISTKKTDYCPNCGAYMRGEAEDEDSN